MNILSQIEGFEEAARSRGVSINSLLNEAGVDRSTWTRWKSGKTLPRMRSWLAVEAAVRKLYEAPPLLRDSGTVEARA